MTPNSYQTALHHAFQAWLRHDERVHKSIQVHAQTHPDQWFGTDADARTRRDWWADPALWCDPWDEWTKSNALTGLLDDIVQRNTEYETFVAIVNMIWGDILTRAQCEAEALYLEAVHLGINPAVYIAHRRGTTVQAAYALLKRADGRKMLNLSSKGSVVDDDYNQKPAYTPSEVEIADKLMSMTVICAGGGSHCQGEAPARFGICWNCLQQFGRPGDRDPGTAHWLEPEIRRVKAQAKREARNQLYAEHAGLVDSPDEYEAVTEAV